ncbi:hypothetical protein [Streptomyces katrae]|uniref:hypothetical protein n=1 Tax=Streptomyces katrae TaxID=68223 RepID=UPI0009A51EF7|nr:hypothetical protein [Streptomyces katrae]
MSGPGELDEDDEALAARCAEMTVEQRGHTALLALWRLRAPLLVLGLDPGWGIHRSAVEAAFRGMLLPVHDEPLPDPGPLFTSPPEAEPEGVVAEVQLEVLAELHAWTTAREPGAEEAERVIRLARDLSRSLDRSCEDSLWDHPARHAHARYLATVAGGGTAVGYHEARNLRVEAACQDLVAALPPGAGLPGTAAGREALALCEAFSAELVSTLAWRENLGY